MHAAAAADMELMITVTMPLLGAGDAGSPEAATACVAPDAADAATAEPAEQSTAGTQPEGQLLLRLSGSPDGSAASPQPQCWTPQHPFPQQQADAGDSPLWEDASAVEVKEGAPAVASSPQQLLFEVDDTRQQALEAHQVHFRATARHAVPSGVSGDQHSRPIASCSPSLPSSCTRQQRLTPPSPLGFTPAARAELRHT